MRFGYKASAEQFAPNTLLKFAIEAEQAGFESVFISDHFQPWKHTDGHAPFAPSWIAAALARAFSTTTSGVLHCARTGSPIARSAWCGSIMAATIWPLRTYL